MTTDTVRAVNVGTAADNGSGARLRDAVEILNSNDALLWQTLTTLLADADPNMNTLRKIADVIAGFYRIVNAVPSAATIQQQIADAAAAVVALVPTAASVQTQISNAIASAVATQLTAIMNGPVATVNGKTGVVTLSPADIGAASAADLATNAAATAARPTLALAVALSAFGGNPIGY